VQLESRVALKLYVEVIRRSAIDAEHNALVGDNGDVERLMNRDLKLLRRLGEAALEFNGMIADDDGEPEGNAGSGTDGDLPSD